MIEAGDAAGLAQRVSHAGVKLAGSKPFWQSAQKDLIAQIQAPDTGTPHIFFTCSSADSQWPDMHQHMPNHDQMPLKMLLHIVPGWLTSIITLQ